MYFKAFKPVLIPTIAAFIFLCFGLHVGILISLIVLNVTSLYLGYNFIKFIKQCRNYKRMKKIKCTFFMKTCEIHSYKPKWRMQTEQAQTSKHLRVYM